MRLKTISVELSAINKLVETEEVAPLSELIVDSYRQRLHGALEYTPLLVCQDGQTFTLFDGYHRLSALQQLGVSSVRVVVYRGDRRDAFRRYVKNQLRSKIVRPKLGIFVHCLERIKSDPQWSAMDDRTLSRLFGRKDSFFANLRLWAANTVGSPVAVRISKHGSATLTRRR